MRSRHAAQSVIEKLLSLYDARPTQSEVKRFFGVPLLRSEETSWYVGARGEIAVATLLATLPANWTVLRSLPVGTKDSDIDHLLVGPAGIFTINTKRHRGKTIWVAAGGFLVSGQKRPYIRNAESEAARVGTLLAARSTVDVPVRPIVALVDPGPITMKEKPRLVTVIDAKRLVRWLRKQPEVLAPETVTDLTALLEDPSMWRASVPVDLTVRFDALDADVRAAARRQMLWTSAGILALFAVGLAALPHLFGRG